MSPAGAGTRRGLDRDAPAARGTAPRPQAPRLAFVGVGWIGLDRLRALVRSGAGRPEVVVDPDPERVRAARQVAPDLRSAPDLQSALKADVDGVVIASPSGLHADQAVAALEAGRAVFCQKPLGRTAEEARRVVNASRRADRPLGVDMAYRWAEAFRGARELVRQGALGEVFAGRLAFHNAYGPDNAWCHDPARAGGGCLIDLGVHLVDTLLWTLGFPAVTAVRSSLYAAGRPLTLGGAAGNGTPRMDPVEDFAQARLELATGGTFDLACSWESHAGRDARIEVELYGSEGGATVRNVDGSFYDFRAAAHTGTRSRVLSEPPDDWPGRAAVDWARRLAAGEGFDVEAERFVQVADVVDRIYGRAPAKSHGANAGGTP